MKNSIRVEKYDNREVERFGVTSWPIWEKGISSFDWSYDETETCYILKGQVEVSTDNGERVKFAGGDKVIFPKGLRCTWHISMPVKKYYKFG